MRIVLQNADRGAMAAGGVNAIGGRSLGCRAAPGAGRISIGGGSGATCWSTTGGGLGDAGAGRGTLTLGFNCKRRGSRPGIGTSEAG